MIWYLAYGSNLCRDRLLTYLRGGRPLGAARSYPGSRDRCAPRADRPAVLPYSLRFAGSSTVWGGGMAYLDLDRPGRTLARAWQLSAEQFADLLAQENHVMPGTLETPTTPAPGERCALAAGRYDLLVGSEPIDGDPAVAVTWSRPPAPTPPSAPYLATLAAGLAETHGLHTDEARAYLDVATRAGVRPLA